MIIVRMTGGLGNQMFQYAAGYALASLHGVELALDISGFESYKLHKFGLDKLQISARILPVGQENRSQVVQRIVRRFARWIGRSECDYTERSLRFDPAFFELNGEAKVEGYFQSQEYFQSFATELRREFVPRKPLRPEHKSLIDQMGERESVMLHIRRGDYVSNAHTLKVHGICTVDYYRNAMTLLESRLTNKPQYFVFSNDMQWVKDHLPMAQGTVFVQGNENAPELELQIMSSCRHHVIANSSFSWWAAWLGQHDGQIVVAPKPWFDSSENDSTDLIPSGWVQVQK